MGRTSPTNRSMQFVFKNFRGWVNSEILIQSAMSGHASHDQNDVQAKSSRHVFCHLVPVQVHRIHAHKVDVAQDAVVLQDFASVDQELLISGEIGLVLLDLGFDIANCVGGQYVEVKLSPHLRLDFNPHAAARAGATTARRHDKVDVVAPIRTDTTRDLRTIF